MWVLCSAVRDLPRDAFEIPATAFNLASGVIMWALPRKAAAAAILALASSVLAGFAVRFVARIMQA